jgi:hypothetical protein
VGLALALMVFPNSLLAIFQIALTTEIWIRVLGVVVFNLGVLYIFMASANNKLFSSLSVYLRAVVLIWFVLFVALELAPPQLILFGAVDAAGALWTYMALRKEG